MCFQAVFCSPLIRFDPDYASAGHCFMCENGIETNNTFLHNLSINTAPAEVCAERANTFWLQAYLHGINQSCVMWR